MESDPSEPKAAQKGSGRPMNGEKSPAGSVKRARQRAAAGLPVETPVPRGILTNANEGSLRNDPGAGDAGWPPGRAPPNKSGAGGSIAGKGQGVSGSDSSSTVGTAQSGPGFTGSPLLQGKAFDDAPQTPTTPINPRRARNYWEDGFQTSSGEGYGSGGSRPSTTATGSSTASIPDFPTIPSMPPVPSTPPVPPIPQMPIPTYQPPPRRNLGPPPSARRGGSSYYSQSAFVPPIPEENSDAHTSYASSHVIPVSWGDGPPEYYMGSGIDEEEEEDQDSNTNSSGRGSRSEDHTEESSLVRKGSKGRPLQPYMETLESGDESDAPAGRMRSKELEWQQKHDSRWQSGFSSTAGGTDPIGRHHQQNGRLGYTPYSGYESDASFLDSPRESGQKINNYFGTPSSRGSPNLQSAILGHLEKGGALSSSGTASPDLSERTEKGFRRPPPLDLSGSTKESPVRGSTTSLPELIRRATKLATNLDRGNTASRIGMLDMLNAKDKETREKSGKASKSGSISDILAAFPSPSPTASMYHKPGGSNWTSPTPHGKSTLSRTQTINYGSSRSEDRRPPRRRCCGMPLWAVILLIIILLLLIAAAVVIPITLVVIPRSNAAAGTMTVTSCSTSNSCKNGGTTIVKNNQCRCICANGFTHSDCSGAPVSDGTCTAVDLPGATSYHNATLGTSVPRLLTAAEPNYSIPLASDTLASLFSFFNLSCSSENALVTFNSKSQRLARSLSDLISSSPEKEAAVLPRALESVLLPNPTPPEVPTHTLQGRASAQTSNDIVFAAGSNSMGSPAAGSSAASASAPSSTSTPPTTSGDTPITPSTLNFARIAILFILQESGSLDTATNALDKMQTLLGTGQSFDPTPVGVTEGDANGGNGTVTVDLVAMTVGWGNGTVYGGKNPARRVVRRTGSWWS